MNYNDKYIFTAIYNYYLIKGTGKPWAGHNNPKLAFCERIKILPLESVENVGAFAPTGSLFYIKFK